MEQLANNIEDSKLIESILSQSIEKNIKCMTLEKGPKRQYNRKSKTYEKAKVLIDQMINEQTNEQNNEQINEQEQIKEQSDPQSDFDLFYEIFSECFTKANEQIQSKTIKERIDGAIIDLYEYRKFTDLKLKNKQQTGHIVDFSLCKDDNFCIIDFDIDHAGKLNEEEKEKIQQNIINNILPKNVVLVLTARGGIHAYCNRNRYKLQTNRNEKVIVYDDNLEIDIFAQMYTHKDGELIANRVVLPNSKVRIIEKGVQKKDILHCKELNDWSNALRLASLHNILGSWNEDLIAKDDDISNTVSYDCILEAMPIEIADACIQCLKGLTIHIDTNTLAKKISLLPLFKGLNGLEQTKDKYYKEYTYITVYRNNILTPKANEHWSDRKGRYSSRANAWILTKIIKLHNKEYYETTLKPLLKKRLQEKNNQKHEIKLETIEKQRIAINDPFIFGNISEKATRGEYKEEADIATDLTKVIRYYAGES
ncbi:MAG: hypothetical protein EZS28_005819 [Streblomastix strix]|uniref:Uncharacterized protein n=1 Tax=Streblomastix strix TaxID=222440 RepID=A0A5J4WVX8_9EUKA|nr:MAG: hypothetical protein EZS28_005819 [Streblomastix strix]